MIQMDRNSIFLYFQQGIVQIPTKLFPYEEVEAMIDFKRAD